mgnify:FL=1
MNYGELKAAAQAWQHRTDLGSQIDLCVQNVSHRLQVRFGITLDPLVNDADTNIILDNNPQVYLYGTSRELAIYTHDAVATQAYEQLYQDEVSRLNITYNGTEWDNTSPAILNEVEQEIADGS